MECLCQDNATQYYRHNFDADTSEYLGGECVEKPNCTAGTQWHPHAYKCEYREPCSDKEHWDEE